MEIVLTDISKQFKNQLIFHNINLHLESGKIYGLIGHNGSGKTVLMKIIAGVMQPSTGSVQVDGRVFDKSFHSLEDVGVIFEKPEFFNDLSGKENLMLLARIKNRINESDVSRVMETVGLDPNNKNKVKSYSLGMVQRLGIAQAIMENQKVLILDEPTNALDPEGVKEILKLLKAKKEEGCLILISSHQLDEIFSICDEVYRFNRQQLEPVNIENERVVQL